MALDDSEVSARRQAFDAMFLGALDRALNAFARHWLFIINTIAGLLGGMAFVAPIFMAIGLHVPAQAIYFFYSYQCHQLAYRSYFVFGYQVAQCHRNTAIYAGFLIAGIAFAFVRARLKPLDWRLYGLLILPMAVDGFTQLFGWRESNWELRTITGGLFALASVWLGYPYVEQAVRAGAQPRRRPHHVVIYGKADCCLCDKAKAIVGRLSEDYDLVVEAVDITTDPELTERYQSLIPVVHVDGRIAAVSKVSELWLRRTLDGA